MLLWQIFILFTRVALFSWGGGPASLALMQRETTAAGWVTPDEFADAVALGNALPVRLPPRSPLMSAISWLASLVQPWLRRGRSCRPPC